MPRRRYTRYRSRRALKTVKYSNETRLLRFQPTMSQNVDFFSQSYEIIPPVQTQGMRKCKNFTFDIFFRAQNPVAATNYAAGKQTQLIFALVFVPQGQNPSAFQAFRSTLNTSESIYEPNQNIIMAGTLEEFKSKRYRTRLARNLNSGDAVYLVANLARPEPTQGTAFEVNCVLNYAVCYN